MDGLNGPWHCEERALETIDRFKTYLDLASIIIYFLFLPLSIFCSVFCVFVLLLR